MWDYLRDLIDRDATPRISAALALLAGVGILLTFLALAVATVSGHPHPVEFGATLTALAALAHFTKIDKQEI
jgi:hypothetical protein